MTPRQKRFLEEFLVDLAVAPAALRAGYSERTAARQGRRLLEKILTEALQGKSAARAAVKPVESPAASEGSKVRLEAIVEGLWNEATRDGEGGSHGARVAAWGHLVRVTGIADNVRHSGEIQYVPPYTPKRGH